ncbi:MAG: PTH1 family peptidyl-tRNA hydrolase [Candidatus Azotimanducaceae bacterium]|jgi:PTH1 family peptidyl-tRNA hydrolase
MQHYIVGLGNPGEEYKSTRHNVGFAALAYIVDVSHFPSFVPSSKYGGLISEGVLEGKDVTLLLPDTFMNMSGSAVKKLVGKGTEANLIVVYDDVDLPLGEIKISFGRGSGGHNGVKSIIESLGSKEFVRIRIGVASLGFFGGMKRPTGDRLSQHVLGKFSKSEWKKLEEVLQRTTDALQAIVCEGVEKAMNEFN